VRAAAGSSLQRTLDELAALAHIRGDAGEVALLDRARRLTSAQGIASDADLGPLFESPPAPADADALVRLRQMYEAGGWVLVESTIADLPADLRWLFESGAVTLEQLAAIHHATGATSVADLAAALEEGSLHGLPGVTADVQTQISLALPTLRRTLPRIPLGRAVSLAEPFLDHLRSLPGVEWARPVGSLRRGSDSVGDIEILANGGDTARAIDDLVHVPSVTRCLHRSARRVNLLIDHTPLGVRFAEPGRAGGELLFLTGSFAHLDALRKHADTMSAALTREGLRMRDGLLRAETEEEIYGALRLPPIPPEIREGGDEVARAIAGTLPRLVSRRDIRGDLHMHTTWSDGRDSTEAMVRECADLGYEYCAITDHSPSSAASRNLTLDGVKRQADEIAELRVHFPRIAILHGCEVDILPDGRLDFPDGVLERFDIVLASLHERAGHAPDRLMKRYAGAMAHPLVSIITHPTNRVVPHRKGYDLNYDELFAMAVETRTIVEVDGSPNHLDLDGPLARRAALAGATLAIDSDCHRAEMLDRQMGFGIATARRGWVEARHVINARPLDEVRAIIGAKRSR
jgi:DNA polymerase (family 10)